MKSLEDKVAALSATRRKKITRRAAQLIAEAMGGDLQLVATFPDHEPVALSGIAGPKPGTVLKTRKRVRGKK